MTHPWRPPSRPVLLAAVLALTVPVLIGAGTALAADDPATAGLPGWAITTGGGLGLAVVGALIAAFNKGWIRIGPVDDDRRHGSGRREVDEETTLALAKAREEGRALGKKEATAELLLQDLEERVAKLEAQVGPRLTAHMEEHGRLIDTLARIDSAVTGSSSRAGR